MEQRYVPVLRSDFEAAVYALSTDLESHEKALRDPARDRGQLALFERWLTDLNGNGLSVAIGDLLLLVELMVANDKANEFDRVAAHHSAYAHLLMQAFAPCTARGRLARWWAGLVDAALGRQP